MKATWTRVSEQAWLCSNKTLFRHWNLDFISFSCHGSGVCVLVTQLCATLCDPMNCGLPGSSVHGILQVRTLGWVAIPFSRISSQLRDWTLVSHIAGRFFTICATREALSSVQFSRSVMSDSLWPYELQHARLPCPSSSPRVHSNSRPSSRWCHPAILSSIISFSSCPQSLPASLFRNDFL